LFLVELEYDLALQEAEATWVRTLLAEFTSGTYPGLDMWRAYHETGEVPQELADLAERTSTTE
jgi:heme A synthase